jgi:hypothetical protein
MKALLSKWLTAPKQQKDSSKILAKAYEESHYSSLWEDTGRVVYLMDTLKLSYESERGLITFEKLSIDDAKAILSDIAEGRLAPLKQKVVAGQTAEIRLSICGLSWQTFNGSTRAKAINDAAVLRSINPYFNDSHALFKHADLIAQHDPGVLSLPNQANVFSYYDVSVNAFFEQLEKINQQFMPKDKSQLCLNRSNYDAPFSEHEQQVLQIEQQLDTLPSNKD